ncbi:hypothetical protein [Pseudomonas putida]
MRDSRLDLPELRRARGVAFSVSVAECYGCQDSAAAVAACEAAHDITVLPQTGTPPELLKLWRRRFKGAVASEPARVSLYERFPDLRGVFDSSLWSLLKPDLLPTRAEELAQSVRVNGKQLAGYSPKSLAILSGCPHWQRLAPLLAILRSKSSAFLMQRCWLRKSFAAFCCLMCVRPGHRKLAVPLWKAIHSLEAQGKLGDIAFWPADAGWFERLLVKQIKLGDRLISNGWVDGWDDECLLWLWSLAEPQHAGLVEALLSTEVFPQAMKPPAVTIEVQRTLVKRARFVVTLSM